ncbi:hypothetical protein [Dawidia soli]|uniref:Uncharacterized protein n=1 Tax=Dawidia soli TaxID=2782352 RepID=A0AAP2GHI2_9BACT|nr:hypothetical protein [Dawidia soli]MBT1686450.1 hypothetical protein [Dawidia soli]
MSIYTLSWGQYAASGDRRYTVGVQYTQEFMLGGDVRVREWEITGDKMPLKDLGIKSYAAVRIWGEYALRKGHRIQLAYDRYFLRGTSRFDREIFYNGTMVDGRTGIDVSPTRYYRISAQYSGCFLDREHVRLWYLGGLVFDHIVFYLDGRVSPNSPMHEVYEDFGRQALPYPVVGLRGEWNDHDGSLCWEVSGTYIPEFKSFYTEGGKVKLQYSNFLADIKYSKRRGDFDLAIGGKLRHMKLFQESREDTNEIRTLSAGPYIEIRYRFGQTL